MAPQDPSIPQIGIAGPASRVRRPLEAEIVFVHLPRSDAVDAAIRRRVEHLTQHCDDLHACRVVVDLAQRHAQQGRPFEVRVDLSLTGHELVANRSRHEDVYVALRDAFDGLTRQLEHVLSRRRAGPRRRETVRHGDGLQASAASETGPGPDRAAPSGDESEPGSPETAAVHVRGHAPEPRAAGTAGPTSR